MDAIVQSGLAATGRSDLCDTYVVHVVRQFAPSIGGLEDVVQNLAVQQLHRCERVRIVTLDRLFTDPGAVLPRQDVMDGIEIRRIPFRGSSRYPLAPSILKEVSGADLVHVHAVDFFFDFLALTKTLHRRKLVATTHGGFFHTPKFARIKAVWFNTLTRFSAHQYAGIACCSESDLRLFNKIAPHKTQLIENGVAIEKFLGAAAHRPRKRMLTLGRFSSNKRLDRLLEMLAVLTSEDPDWHLDIAGIESDLTRTELLQRASALGLDNKIGIHVGLSNRDLRDLIGQSSLFVSASEYEGFGLVLVEALSAGLLPVVQANDAFAAIACKHKLVRTLDFADARKAAETMKSSLAALENDPGLRQGAIEAASEYGWAAKARQYEALYQAALSG